ncbi:MAG TPA: Wzz/FepE/Etk N-terminal domain-containing protein [Terracidiphilus sp.]|jgi:uncharacterized protein involved in exopolysaccharide biosynthesis
MKDLTISSSTHDSMARGHDSMVRGFVESVFRHRVRFFGVLGFFLGLTVLYVFFSHKKYESDMSLIVENARKPQVLSAEPTTGAQALVSQVTEEQVYSQIEILGSADVLDEVVDPGWRNVPLAAHPEATQLEHENKVNRLRNHLTIAPVRKSNVIDVSYRANDPLESTRTLQRVLDVFLAREKTVSEPPGAARFFDAEATRYKAQWATAQQQLADFQQAHHLVSIADKETQLEQATADALVLQRAAEAETDEVTHRLHADLMARDATPMRQKTDERVVPAAGSVDQVNTLLAQLNLRRAQLLTEYLPSDRIVQQVDSQIDQAKAELTASKALQSVQVSTNINPSWQTLDQAVIEEGSHLRAVKARRSVIASQVGTMQQQLKSVEGDTLAFNSLQQKVAQLNANYQLYLQKRDAAQISEAMNQEGLINIGIAQSPTFSLIPVRPRPLIDSVLGVFTSLFLACFAVFLADANRQTIASPAELQGMTPYPLLATVALGDVADQTELTPESRPSFTNTRRRHG